MYNASASSASRINFHSNKERRLGEGRTVPMTPTRQTDNQNDWRSNARHRQTKTEIHTHTYSQSDRLTQTHNYTHPPALPLSVRSLINLRPTVCLQCLCHIMSCTSVCFLPSLCLTVCFFMRIFPWTYVTQQYNANESIGGTKLLCTIGFGQNLHTESIIWFALKPTLLKDRHPTRDSLCYM